MFTIDELKEIQTESIIPGSSGIESPYFSMHQFLMGSCDIFAKTLHEIFGYKTFIRKKGSSLHCFCKSQSNNEIFYIDARGVTNSFWDFIVAFPDLLSAKDVPIEITDELEADWNSENKYYHVGIEIAKEFIKDNEKHYRLDTL